jgi:two-component system, NarL family, nitrate/nitrite response regulator NarL
VPIRIIIADREEMFRDGLKRLLNTQPDFETLADFADGDALPAMVAQYKPDVLLFGQRLRKCSGIDAVRTIRGSDTEVRPILLTAAIEESEIIRALLCGVRGVVRKATGADLLFKSIRTVMNGGYWVGHDGISEIINSLRSLSVLVEQKTKQQANNLTSQQLKIIYAIVSGCSNKDIAKDLSISERTVKYHLTRIFSKFGVSGRMELARYSLINKVLPEN